MLINYLKQCLAVGKFSTNTSYHVTKYLGVKKRLGMYDWRM